MLACLISAQTLCLFFLQPLFEEEGVPREGKRMHLRRHEGMPCIKGLQIMSKTAWAYVMGEMIYSL